MTILNTIFKRQLSNLKDWAVSIHRNLFFSEDWPEQRAHTFKDPYADYEAMHDKEMERLVKILERMKSDDHTARYQ